MSEKIAQPNEEVIEGQLRKSVRGSVEENAERATGAGSGETDADGAVRAQRGPAGVSERTL